MSDYDPRSARKRDNKWELRLEDRLDLLRYAPRDRALEILHLMLEAVFGEGYIRGAEDNRGSGKSERSVALSDD